MECANESHFDELLSKLCPETIDQILADLRVAPNDQYCFRLPSPKNSQEKEAMDKFNRTLLHMTTDDDPKTFPRLFPFLK